MPIVLCSKGIGSNYTKREHIKKIHQFDDNTIEFYRLENGTKINLPIYYRNKLWTEEQRENLWLKRLDKDERFIMGIKIANFSSKEGQEQYKRILETAQRTNKLLGFGDLSKEWQKKDYNVTVKMLQKSKKKN